jgi:hypothetical protein
MYVVLQYAIFSLSFIEGYYLVDGNDEAAMFYILAFLNMFMFSFVN